MVIRTISDFRNESKDSNSHEDSQPILYGLPSGISMLQAPPIPGEFDAHIVQKIFPRMKLRSIVTALSLFDFLMFIITLGVASTCGGTFDPDNTMAGPNPIALYVMGGQYAQAVINGAVWRLLTPIFLHSGFYHIMSNMFFQLRLGYVLELRWGMVRFLVIYILCGINGSMWSTELGSMKAVSVGASGALFGVMGANISWLIYNWREVPDNKREACFMFFFFALNILFSFAPNVDINAHLGGFVCGLALGVTIPNPIVDQRREKLIRLGGFGLYVFLVVLFSCLIWSHPSIPFDYQC